MNDHECGRIADYALQQPCVRGVAFQPITGITFLLLRLLLLDVAGLSAHHRRRLERIGHEAAAILPKLRDATPIMLFRVGVGPAPSDRAPRLPVSRLLSIDAC